jgi:ribulose-phosphate 3-epimerase
LDRILEEVDSLLVMSVNPGFAGQKFMPQALEKIRRLKSRFPGEIAVDGGINEASAPLVVKAGADVLITASYFYNSADPGGVVRYLKGLGR